jgi:glyoxylase I family protein
MPDAPGLLLRTIPRELLATNGHGDPWLVMIRGLHHLGLTVRDVEDSAAWYEQVLGLRRIDRYESPDGTRRKIFLGHDHLAIRLGLTQHRDSRLEEFDETRTGLDHLAFAVRDRDELDSWALRLDRAGVTSSPIAPANSIQGAFVLVFRDPDNIQLELFSDRSDANR